VFERILLHGFYLQVVYCFDKGDRHRRTSMQVSREISDSKELLNEQSGFLSSYIRVFPEKDLCLLMSV
jgi:hypothetical protein